MRRPDLFVRLQPTREDMKLLRVAEEEFARKSGKGDA
jgi:hypothetical protein